jgi:hypothetical protein
MGLDMCMQGHFYKYGDNRETLDDFPIKEIIVELGYWRKHPDLHGAIVQTFAAGVDNCQEIGLGRQDIETLLYMVKSNQLPHTEGFFFGTSAKPESIWYEEERTRTVKQLENALRWYDSKKGSNEYRWVTYRASW